MVMDLKDLSNWIALAIAIPLLFFGLRGFLKGML